MHGTEDEGKTKTEVGENPEARVALVNDTALMGDQVLTTIPKVGRGDVIDINKRLLIFSP